MTEFCGLLPKEIKRYFAELDQPSFRANQLCDWVYRKRVLDYDQMLNLPQPLRSVLSSNLLIDRLIVENIEVSKEGDTKKFLWRLHDGHLLESVLISSGDRRTVCVSSQVGCPARCAFCASGKNGVIRQLSSAEIIEQVVNIQQHLMKSSESVSHLVFMGMGEPLENYDEVVKALKILIAPALLGFSPRKITVSTVGVVPNIKRLMMEDLKVNLALSLHAPNQRIRQKIVPYARRFAFDDVLKAARDYAKYTKRNLTYEYVLLAGINDAREHAHELAMLLYKEQCTVNVIPYNPIDGVRLNRPDRLQIEAFCRVLSDHGVCVTRRFTKGSDIAAACGQLAAQKKP